MIKIEWPLNLITGDAEVYIWLENLVEQDTAVNVFELSEDCASLYFFRVEDAVAFKLRFGFGL